MTRADWLRLSGDAVRLSSPSTRTAAPTTRTVVVSSSSTAEDETFSHFVTAKKAAGTNRQVSGDIGSKDIVLTGGRAKFAQAHARPEHKAAERDRVREIEFHGHTARDAHVVAALWYGGGPAATIGPQAIETAPRPAQKCNAKL